MESYEKVLIAWTSVKDHLADGSSGGEDAESSEQLRHQLVELVFAKLGRSLVEAFVHSRLSSAASAYNAELERNSEYECGGLDNDTDDDDDNESSEDDLQRYKEVLYAIGSLARHSLELCLPMLAK